MNRITLLVAGVPASIGATLVLSSAGAPLPAPWPVVVRVVAFFCWLGAIVLAALGASREPRRRFNVTKSVVAAVTCLVGILAGSLVLGYVGASTHTQGAWAVLMLACLVLWLAAIWQRSAMRVAGQVVLGLSVVGLGLSFTSLRGATPLVAGVLAGLVLLGQGLWNGVRSARGVS